MNHWKATPYTPSIAAEEQATTVHELIRKLLPSQDPRQQLIRNQGLVNQDQDAEGFLQKRISGFGFGFPGLG